MCHAFVQDPAFFRLLTRLDEEFAAATRLRGCRFCAGPLHVANYPRKLRGCPAAAQDVYSRRFSFTCGRCGRRATPPSVRFAGHRVYLAVVLMLVSPARQCFGAGALRPAAPRQPARDARGRGFVATGVCDAMRAAFLGKLPE